MRIYSAHVLGAKIHYELDSRVMILVNEFDKISAWRPPIAAILWRQIEVRCGSRTLIESVIEIRDFVSTNRYDMQHDGN